MKSTCSTLIFSLSILFFLLSLPSPAFSATKCNPQDKAALLQIKAAFNNPYFLSSWNPNTDCCTWYSLQCDSNSPYRVIQLTIFSDSGNLTGPIPAAIGNLPFLQMIDFNHLPNVNGPIPSAIANLPNLTFLRLSYLKLSGPVPTFLTQLPNLGFLDVSHNQLCGPIPQGGNLQSFDARYYSSNKCLCGAPLPSC